MEHIQVRRDGDVGVVTIDRQHRSNSLDIRTAHDLCRSTLQFARDHYVRAIVIRGAGGAFCGGADLRYVAVGGEPKDRQYIRSASFGVPPSFGEILREILEDLHISIAEIRRTPKPVIAEVDGIAASGGLGLALACDLVIASTRAFFELGYSKAGLNGADGLTFLLPRLIGLRRSIEMTLLNARLDAKRALELGLITAIQPVESLEQVVMGLAQKLASGPTQAFAASKDLLNQAAGIERLEEHLAQERDHYVRAADGPEFAEGLEAYLENRGPVFRSGV